MIELQEDIKKIIEHNIGVDTDLLEREMHDCEKQFLLGCLTENNCYQKPASSALVGISLIAGNLCQAHGFEPYSKEGLSSAISTLATFSYLHYRYLRCYKKRQNDESLYAIGLNDMGFALSAAIFIGADKEAMWMATEYVRHVEESYQCPISPDASFNQFCYWIAKCYLAEEVILNEGSIDSFGIYGSLAKNENFGGDLEKIFISTLNQRTNLAIKTSLYNNQDIVVYYDDFFTAVFPFELMAFKVLIARYKQEEIDIDHPIINHLWDVEGLDKSILSEQFPEKVEKKIQILEKELGLESILC